MEKQRPFSKRKFTAMLSLLLLASFLAVPQAWGMNFQLHPDISMDLDTTLIYGASMRMKDADEKNLGLNVDDGNRSFEQYDLVSNRFTVRSALDLRRKHVGVFARGRAFYDDAYHGSNANDSPETHNNFLGGSLDDHQKFTDAAEDQHGQDLELLDLYGYADFSIAGRPLSLRVGQQVVSWGESLFTLGGISTAQGYADANMLNVPGAELVDIFLPSEQVSARFNFFRNLSIAGYYQWEWKKHRSEAVGSYFSTMDFADEGGYHMLAAPGVPVTADRIDDDPASDSGQWGVSLNYYAENLNSTEFGLYYLNYHEKFPLVFTVPGAGNLTMDWGDPMLNFFDSLGYYLGYQEDIDLYGASFSTQVGPTNVSGEVTYRADYATQVADPTAPLKFSYEPFDIVQALASAIHVFGPFAFVDTSTLMFEVGMNEVLDDENLFKDKFAWGSTTRMSFSFFQVLPQLDMTVPVSFKHRPNGKSSLPGTFTEDQHQVSVGTDFIFRQKYEFGLSYTDFLGSAGDEDLKSDRDYLAFYVMYTF